MKSRLTVSDICGLRDSGEIIEQKRSAGKKNEEGFGLLSIHCSNQRLKLVHSVPCMRAPLSLLCVALADKVFRFALQVWRSNKKEYLRSQSSL